MTNRKSGGNSGVNRRGFLKTLGWAAGAAITAPLLPANESVARASGAVGGRDAFKIGILLPSSSAYPAMGQNLVAGMDLFLQQAGGRRFSLVTEEIGAGLGSALKKSRKLLQEDRTDFVVGLISPFVAASLRDLYEEHETILIASNVGADMVRSEQQSPWIFHNSLGLWQANGALGMWAGQNLGKRVFVAASFYDSGYDALYAFRRGFEAVEGEHLATYVTHKPADAGGFGSLFAAIDGAKPDFVYACYHGQQAVDFVRGYAAAGLMGRIPLVGSGFVVDDALLPELGRAALGIKTVFPWASSLTTPANQAFVQAFGDQTGRSADAFALLGYDTAQLLLTAIKAVDGDTSRRYKMRSALKTARLVSPRGLLRMSSRAQSASTPLYLREVRQQGGALRNAVLSKLDSVAEIDRWGPALQAGLKTGWFDPYLSI